jgi:FtsP/CotA-like multicopper oxidase with cupredoxin domain
MKRIFREKKIKLEAFLEIFKRRKQRYILLTVLAFLIAGFALISVETGVSQAQSSSACFPPAPGSVVTNPPEILNPNASNPANFTVLSVAPGQDCYLANGNLVAPTIRVEPGKKDIVLRLTNRLSGELLPEIKQTDCVGGEKMAPPNSTNLHYHGLNISPACGQDEVVKTVIEPNKTFQFNIKIPKEEPPGLYWYHPHVHMQSQEQVLSGLTGAIIIEGIKDYNKQAAKLPERVFVLRDLNPKGFPESDTAQPANDISINSIPIRYLGNGKYEQPAVIQIKPNEEQFWRVANTAANTYFDLQLTYDGTPQQLALVGMDGVPVNEDGKKDRTLSVTHILLAPAGRAEFIVKGPSQNVKDAKFLTLNVDRNADNNPQRTIAKIAQNSEFVAPEPSSESDPSENSSPSETSDQTPVDRFSGLEEENPVQQRSLYFSQIEFPEPTPEVPDAMKEEFYITLDGNTPRVYDPSNLTPDITVKEGTTEEWVVENRAPEAHAFHIHQVHFLVLNSDNASDIGMVRDTINIAAWQGNGTPYPSVKLRMDFRGIKKDTSIAGKFVYHCHILEHEDGGMMAIIEVIK